MKIRKHLFVVALTVSATIQGQNTDLVRAGIYSNYDIRMRNAVTAQSAAIATMTFHNKWIQGKEDDIADLQREFDHYLTDLHDVIAIAAQLYGNYIEFTEMVSNLKKIGEACEESPTNILANAFNENKRQIVTNIVSTTTDLVLDLKKTFVDATRMTEKERIQNLDDIRRKMKTINGMLKRTERQIRYYNLCDLWNDIRNQTYSFRHLTNAEIARRARDEWQEHYKPIFSDAQLSDR